MREKSKLKFFIICIALSIITGSVNAEYFDPGLLQSVGGKKTITDANLLSQGVQPAGDYRVHVEVNGNPILFGNIKFKLDKNKNLYPCLSFKQYEKFGVDMKKMESGAKDNEITGDCIPFEQQLSDVKTEFDFSKLALSISLPQTVMRDEGLTGVPKDEWDDGFPGFINTYQLSGQKYITTKSNEVDSVFANTTNGMNIGRWRYRNNSTVSNEQNWTNVSNYVETSIKALNSELTLGDSSTNGDIFDSLQLRGVQIASDIDMLPDQLNGFAPVVRGIARSNARVEIRDNGNIIYQRSVPPGPFVINDIESLADSGKLDVTIIEADGTKRQSSQNYSNVSQLLRQGQFKYSFATGNIIVTDDTKVSHPQLVQVALQLGLPQNITTYGGLQFNEKYKAVNSGVGIDLQQLGGIALDVTHSKFTEMRLTDRSKVQTGNMFRLTYRNSLPLTGTQIEFNNKYYYNDYVGINDWVSGEYLTVPKKKKELNFTMNQSFSDDSSLYTTITQTVNTDNTTSNMGQIGLSSSFGPVSFSVSYSTTRSESEEEWDKQISINLSIPLSSMFPHTNPVINYSTSSGMKGDLTNHLGVNGNFSDDENLSWNSQLSWAKNESDTEDSSYSIGVNYQGGRGDYDLTYNSDINQYLSWNASGSVMLHQHGLTTGKYSSGSIALVEIPGVADVPLENALGLETDKKGYALISDLRPYHRNKISIDAEKVNRAFDFKSTSSQMVPTKDAFVVAKFDAVKGRKAVITLTHDREIIAFGSRVKINGMDEQYYVGDKGQVYINTLPDQGIINVSWSDNQSCSAPYKLQKEAGVSPPLSLFSVSCQ